MDFLSGGNSESKMFICKWKPSLELGGNSFSRKSLFLLLENCEFWLVETTFFLHFSYIPANSSVKFSTGSAAPYSGKVFFKTILHFS